MKKIIKIGYHLLIWISLPALAIYFDYANQDFSRFPGMESAKTFSFFEVLKNSGDTIFYILLYSVPSFYLSYSILIPKLLFKRKPLNVILYLTAIVVFVNFFPYTFIYFLPMYGYFGTPYGMKVLVPIVTLTVLASLYLAYNEKHRKDKTAKIELEKQNFKLELDVLKSTINPHFLFNTLNNIDILINKDDKRASEYLKKLSDLLRFILHDTQNNYIPLETEINNINRYIELQRIRTLNSEFVDLEITGKTEGWKIPPMTYIPFVENAFKYSTNKNIRKAVQIKFDINNKNVLFYCKNIISDCSTRIESNGLGIKLIEQRLKLLYQDKFKLKLKEEDGVFIVNLKIGE